MTLLRGARAAGNLSGMAAPATRLRLLDVVELDAPPAPWAPGVRGPIVRPPAGGKVIVELREPGFDEPVEVEVPATSVRVVRAYPAGCRNVRIPLPRLRRRRRS